MTPEESFELHERVARLETDRKYMKADIEAIKLQVTNHIPTAIAELTEKVEASNKRHDAIDTIAKFVSMIFKGVAAIVALMWSIKHFFGK